MPKYAETIGFSFLNKISLILYNVVECVLRED